jgi:hypothetical protein
MKSLVYGCAAAALLMGAAIQARAEIAVQDAPVHAVPVDEDAAPDDAAPPAAVKAEAPAPAPVAAPAAAKPEPAVVKALVQPKAPAPVLTPDENAFFAALGRRITDAASAYESYVRRAGAIDPAFTGAASVQRAVKTSAAYHPHQLEEGIVAYAALIALRNPDFVEGVRAMQGPAFADGLAQHPERVMQVRGAGAAAADAAGVLKAQGEALIAAGKAVTKAAYDIQRQAWSKSPVADPRAVLDAAKTSADEMRTATVPSKERLLSSLVTAPQSPDGASAPAPDVVRGLALAALAILGRTGDGTEAQWEALLYDPATDDCLKLAKMNLNQCLAVAGPHYEDVYCAGRHAVSDTGKCVAAAADGGAPDAAPEPKLQTADAMGPEEAAAYGRAAPAPDADDRDDGLAPAPPPAAAQPAAPRRYAEAPQAEPPAPPSAGAYAPQPRLQPQPQPPQPSYSYAQNDYARQPAYPPQAYAQQGYPQQQAYPEQGYAPPQYQPAPYQQPYAQPQYAPRRYAQQTYPQPGYAQPQQPAPHQQPYPSQQPYYPQGYGYQNQGYYGR